MKIFISIACFLDPDIVDTIKDCLNKARHPENLVFGVCLQSVGTNDFFSDFEKHEQIRLTRLNYLDAKGPTYARYHCTQLLQDEEFFLQIDSHTRFVTDWDTVLLDMWAQCKDPRGLITCFPLGFRKMDRYKTEPLNRSPRDFHEISRENIRLGSVYCEQRRLLPTFNLSAAFLFGKAECLREVALDPHLIFCFQKVEQQFYAVRLFTHGWNLYMPDKHVVFTNYDKTEHYVAGTRVWPPSNSDRGQQSWERALFFYGVLETSQLSHEVNKDLRVYGMGVERTVDDFFEIHGHTDVTYKLRNGYAYRNKKWINQ